MGKSFDLLVHTIFYCVGAGLNTLMSTCDGLGPYILRPNTEQTRPVREKMDEKVVISRQGRHYFL